MIDQPRPVPLLNAMAKTLTERVVPEASGSAQHAARVVANLCEILARELASPGTEQVGGELEELLGLSGDVSDLVDALDQRLQSDDEAFDRRSLPIVMRDVERRLSISKPSYLKNR